MKYITTAVALLCLTMTGCLGKQTLGKSIGTAWVTHNTATSTAVSLGEAGVLDLSDLDQFSSFQKPVKESLDAATDEYLSEDFSKAQLYLDLAGPLLERMVELTEEADNGN